MVNRIGILGGTFDPPHVGHLILAETAADALGLSRVLFVPAAVPPHKIKWHVSSIEHRLAMLRLAIADEKRFFVSRVDIDRPGPHYSVDMLALLQQEYPDQALFFLMGADSLNDFPTWRDPEGILALAELAVMRRPGAEIDMTKIVAAVPAVADHFAVFESPLIEIAATDLRTQINAGHSIRYQVPDAVIAYIQEHQLYRAES